MQRYEYVSLCPGNGDAHNGYAEVANRADMGGWEVMQVVSAVQGTWSLLCRRPRRAATIAETRAASRAGQMRRGPVLRKMRKDAGFTQKDVGRAMGTTGQMIAIAEQGKSCSVERYEKIAETIKQMAWAERQARR